MTAWKPRGTNAKNGQERMLRLLNTALNTGKTAASVIALLVIAGAALFHPVSDWLIGTGGGSGSGNPAIARFYLPLLVIMAALFWLNRSRKMAKKNSGGSGRW